MDSNSPANYPPDAAHAAANFPSNAAPPPNQYLHYNQPYPHYNQPHPTTHYDHHYHHPNFNNPPNAPAAFTGHAAPYWPDARKRKFHNPNRGPPPASFESFAKLYVSQVPRTSTEDDIRSVFGHYGKIIEVVFIRDKRTGQQQGPCFVKFATVGEAEGAIHALHNQYTYPGETESLKVKFADGEHERLGIHGLKLYVNNLNKQASKKEIEELFSKYGDVEDVHILQDEFKHSRGTGFIKFSHRYMAEAAINALNGTHFMMECEYPLVVRFADAKNPPSGNPRYKLPRTHAITGGQVLPCNIHQAPEIHRGAPEERCPTNPLTLAVPPVVHKQPHVTAPSVSPRGFHPQQQYSPLMPPATCNTLQESSSQPFTDKVALVEQNNDQTPLPQQREDQTSLPQQKTDQSIPPEQNSCMKTKLHAVDNLGDLETVEPASDCASHMTSSSLEAISSLDCDWSEHFCPDGQKYYYNCETCESRWEKPTEYASFEKQVLKHIQNETSYSASQTLLSREVLSSR